MGAEQEPQFNVAKTALAESLFKIPADYKKVTVKEFLETEED